MRGFPDLVSREPMKAKFYEGELWTSELENVLLPMLENYEVVVVEDADGSFTGSELLKDAHRSASYPAQSFRVAAVFILVFVFAIVVVFLFVFVLRVGLISKNEIGKCPAIRMR
jgi:hypothetical protein